jgi:hypothetical protein
MGPTSIHFDDDGGVITLSTEERFPNLGLTWHKCLELVNHNGACPINRQGLRTMTVRDDQIDGIFDGIIAFRGAGPATLGF